MTINIDLSVKLIHLGIIKTLQHNTEQVAQQLLVTLHITVTS